MQLKTFERTFQTFTAVEKRMFRIDGRNLHVMNKFAEIMMQTRRMLLLFHAAFHK